MTGLFRYPQKVVGKTFATFAHIFTSSNFLHLMRSEKYRNLLLYTKINYITV